MDNISGKINTLAWSNKKWLCEADVEDFIAKVINGINGEEGLLSRLQRIAIAKNRREPTNHNTNTTPNWTRRSSKANVRTK